MSRGRDEAGNIWELDAQGNPVRLVQPARQSAIPGALAIVPPNPAMVAKNQREAARQDAADARANRADERAAQADARAQADFDSKNTMVPPPGDTTKTGDEYLATIPTSLAGQVKALSEGRRAFPTGAALRSPSVQELIAAATQYDPTLDAANAATRVATRKKFTSGTTRDNITAINTALGHLGTLWQDAQKLNNFGSPMVNAPINAIESGVLGDARYTNFNLTRHAVVDELEKAFRGSGGTQAGIDEWKQGINNSQSPEQLRGAVGKAVELLQSRLGALSDAYSTGMGRSADPMEFLNPHARAVFGALGPGGDGNVPDLPKDFGGAPPVLGGNDKPPPPSGPPLIDKGAAAPALEAATGKTRAEFDPTFAAGMNALVRRNRPYEEAAAYSKSNGFPVPDPHQYAAALAYQKSHPDFTGGFSKPTKIVPTTAFQRFAASPLAAGISGAATGATAGFNDEAAGAISALTGGDYTEGRDAFNAKKNILAELHPTADMAGQVVGGVSAGLGGGAAVSRIPGALAMTSKLGRFAPAVGDAAYGATYGAGENNDNRLLGAGVGALTGAGSGYAGRKLAGGLANIVAPPAGNFGPAYAQGVFPTIGQRFGQSGFAGRALNTAEQAMQSMPGLGSLVTRARDIPRDAAQVGAFNEALGEIGHKLPDVMVPGTEPHSFTTKAFGKVYDLARSGMQFVPDGQYVTDHQAFNGVLNNGVLDAAQAAQVQKVISTSVGSRLPRSGGAMTGDAYKLASSDMGRAIDIWSRNPNTQPMANALSEYQTIFDSAARRNSDPAAVNLLDAADRGWAKYARVRNAGARVGGDPGTFTMKNLARAVQQEGGGVASGPFQRGQALMQDYSTAIQPLGDTLSNSGTGERLLTNKMMLGGQAGAGAIGYGAGAGGALAAHPGALAPFGLYAPGINKLVTRAIAPREATLPPAVADFLNATALKIRNRAPIFGRLAVPGALALETGQ